MPEDPVASKFPVNDLPAPWVAKPQLAHDGLPNPLAFLQDGKGNATHVGCVFEHADGKVEVCVGDRIERVRVPCASGKGQNRMGSTCGLKCGRGFEVTAKRDVSTLFHHHGADCVERHPGLNEWVHLGEALRHERLCRVLPKVDVDALSAREFDSYMAFSDAALVQRRVHCTHQGMADADECC